MKKNNGMVTRLIRMALCGLISFYCMISLCQSEKAADRNLNEFLENLPGGQGQAEIMLRPGERMVYEFLSHGSVGISCRYLIEDDAIVTLAQQKEEYKHPERLDVPGADEATGIFCFEAVKPGRTVVTLQHLFRGGIEKETRLNVVVTE